MTTATGLDLSLTSTGVAAIEADAITTGRIESQAPVTPRHPRTGKPLPPTLRQRDQRLWDLAKAIIAATTGHLPDLVVIEQPAFSRNIGSSHDRSGLWWLVVRTLHGIGIPVAEITPTQRAKYATGNGGAGKDAVLLAVARRYPQVEISGNDEADALVLAAMGARWLGSPIDDLPKTHLAAFDSVVWPVREEVR